MPYGRGLGETAARDYAGAATDVPDDEGDTSRDLYALQTYHTPQDSEDEDGDTAEEQERTPYDYGETDKPDFEDKADSDTASVSSRASSSADSAPLDRSHEDYLQWLIDGCPDSDTEYSH